MWSSVKIISVTLDCISAAGLALGASATAGSSFNPDHLADGLIIAAVAHAISGVLKQASGDSDEVQGITPQQLAAKATPTFTPIPDPVITTDANGNTTITQGKHVVVLPPTTQVRQAVTSKP